VLLVLLSVVTISLVSRRAIEATILRAPGMLYQEAEPGKISNLYNIKLVNKTKEDLPVEIKLLSPAGTIQVIGGEILVKQESVGESVFFTILLSLLINWKSLLAFTAVINSLKKKQLALSDLTSHNDEI
jgi:hypothetical protein